MKNKNSSYLTLPENKLYRSAFLIYEYLSALADPVTWILDKRVKTVLDVGCGQGYPMRLLKLIRKDIKITGVELFDEYIKEAKKSGVFDKIYKKDATKLNFKKNSFDAVISLQVIEHIRKKEGLKMLKNFEKIAKYQVIVATPVHFFEHPEMDGNKLQRHLSKWSEKEFKKLGYKVKKQGLEIFFGDENGIVHQGVPRVLKATVFILDKLLAPLYMFIPGFADYWLIAFKKVD